MSTWADDDDIQPPRACDRCHAIKERCEWMPDGKQCERCLRLQHVCRNIRPKGRPGRKPQRRNPRHGTWALKTIPRCVSEIDAIPTGEKQIVQRLFVHSNLLDLFSVGSSFTERVRRQVIPHLLHSNTLLLDGILACAISWAGDFGGGQASPGRLSSCYRHASSAVSTLSSLKVTNSQTMKDCVMLGALISTFAVKMRLNDVLAISGQTLGLIEPVYALGDPAQHELMPFLSCMVMWDLRGCLFSCTLPSMRFKPPADAYVDRHVGLCADLLPVLHDICVMSHALAHGHDILEELDVLDASIHQWQPTIPDDFTTGFNAIEVAHMLCQAQVMRLTALLVTHRLRYPFGVNDGPAQTLSMTILTQLELTLAATKHPVRCTDLALLVACLELVGNERQKWLCNIVAFAGFSPQFGEHLQSTLVSFWTAMDTLKTVSWSELTALGSPFLRNPGINEGLGR